MLSKDDMIDQSLAMCNNYLYTRQTKKFSELIKVVQRLDPENSLLQSLSPNSPSQQAIDFFGRHWEGESLDDKSIEIFCDQGMGDLINMLGYIRELKQRWRVRIVLNCYAYFAQFKRLLEDQTWIDVFTSKHIKCDYHTNMFSIPSILCGLKHDVYYPARFKEVIQHDVPDPPLLFPQIADFHVGVAWHSNPENKILFDKKSFDIELLRQWCMPRLQFHSLLPGKYEIDFLSELGETWFDLQTTASVISQMDAIISVDTVVLHLAGSMRVPTFGLLCYDSDPRWGWKEGNQWAISKWYPTVTLVWQDKVGNWEYPIAATMNQIIKMHKKKLSSFGL